MTGPCHSLFTNASLLAAALFPWQTPVDRPTGPVSACVTAECHGDVLRGSALHAPAAQRRCQACHQLADAAAHRFAFAAAPRRLCSLCHVQSHRTFVHEAVAEGDCTGCHDPHGSDHRLHLHEDPAGGLCFRCHPAEKFEREGHVHGPVAAGACVVCHESHSSWYPDLLAREETDLCLLCHEDVVDRLARSRHSHQAVVDRACTVCHDPHASTHPAQLRGGAPQLCFSCHEHEPIRRLVETSKHVHGAIRTEESCTACHLGHGGMLPKLLAEPLMGLCLSCHDRPIETADGNRLADMATVLKNNPDHHGPVDRANCSACHNPHASANFRLLSQEYPEMFYAPFDLQNYDLCFSCHIKEMVTEESGTGVTGFRHGERNLHFVHVNKETKGRTCRACHEVHASRSPFHIRQKVPFGTGGWEIEINFNVLPDGGRCAPGCHEPQEYARNPDGGALLPAPDLKVDADQ
ncbi:MAG: hypothetical protein JSU68_10230 [Phycisphaerales bacterium]|nr:MAG: hypothetical protein JSU68_10230 [Phycisphaerales bacterium]